MHMHLSTEIQMYKTNLEGMELEINKFLITEIPAQLSAIKQEAETSTDTEEQAGPLPQRRNVPQTDHARP